MKTNRNGSFADIRPARTAYDMEGDSVKASFSKGGRFQIEYRNHFGEKVCIPFLFRVEASERLSKLRSRGYQGSVKPMK